MINFTPFEQPIIAHAVLQAIDRAIESDGGARFRTLERTMLPLAADAYRDREAPHRAHLGASAIGARCERYLWYAFHWAFTDPHDARLLRLFNRGHLEEGRIAALLTMIGYTLVTHNAEGKQLRMEAAHGHFGGSCDGALHDAQKMWVALLEAKTHNRSSFEKLTGPVKEWRAHVADPVNTRFTGEGVRKSKPLHYSQAQAYLRGFDIQACLYFAVCKDTDDVYAEWVRRDDKAGDAILAKAERVIRSQEPPPKINQSPGWHECRFCAAKGICHNKATPERNCRTCANSRVATEGAWVCGLTQAPLSEEAQLIGCPEHKLITGLV